MPGGSCLNSPDGVETFTGAAPVPGAGESDLIYSINCTTPSSVTNPWKVGMSGWKPATTLASGCKIDSRM